MNCPRDNRPMVLDEYKTHPRHECKRCRGILLEGRHIAATLGSLRAGVPDTPDGSPRLLKLPESSLRCPNDDAPMRVATYSGVEIDVCPVCRSVWLDRGEYEKVVSIDKQRRADGPRPAASEGIGSAPTLDGDDVIDLVEAAVEILLDR